MGRMTMQKLESKCCRNTSIILAMVLAFVPAWSQDNKRDIQATPSNIQLNSPSIDRRVNALLEKMTLEEKLGQLVQYNSAGATSATVAAGQAADLAQNPQAKY